MENQEENKPAINSIHDINPELLKLLYNLPSDLEAQVKDVEEKSGIRREHFFYGFSLFLAIYMIVGSEAGLLCNIICFTYPCIITIEAVEKKMEHKAYLLLLYWITLGFFTFLDLYGKQIMKIFPLYWLFKSIFFMYLYLPQTEGIKAFNKKVIQPILKEITKHTTEKAP